VVKKMIKKEFRLGKVGGRYINGRKKGLIRLIEICFLLMISKCDFVVGKPLHW